MAIMDVPARCAQIRLSRSVELGAGWDALVASLGRPAAQEGIKVLTAHGFHKPGMSKISSDTIWAKLRARERDFEHRICNEYRIERSYQ